MAGIEHRANTLDRMLDDLKTTVGPDVSTHDVRNDSSLVSSFRSSSRNGERNSESRGGSRSRSGSAVGIEDGGRVKHTRHEYTPDDNSKVVTEKFEYDTGDTNKTNHYQKKVIKSTYSTFSHKTAGSLDDPPHLLDHAPESPPERPPPDTKVVNATQKVANKLVHALSTIGAEEGDIPPQSDYSDSDTLKTETSVTTGGSDYSTLTRLKKNINELDSLIYNLDETEKGQTPEPVPRQASNLTVASVEAHSSSQVSKSSHVKHMHVERSSHTSSTVSSSIEKSIEDQVEDQISGISDSELELRVTPQVSPQKTSGTSEASITPVPSEVASVVEKMNESLEKSIEDQIEDQISVVSDTELELRVSPQKTPGTSETSITPVPSDVTSDIEKINEISTTSLHNGTNGQQTQQYDADEEEEDYTKSGEVRRIVWRNRYEKTYEGSDSQQAPQPPTVSPGASSWAEPIPLPTPPQLSPREPGVAYIYTYGQDASGSQVKPLPNLNYVQVPGAGSVPPSEGAPSPTPSQLQQGQPIIYHYSYHYNIQPNADGTMPAMAGVPPPALQMAPTTHTLPAGQIVNVQPGTQQSPPEHPHQPGGSNSINYNITSSSVSSNKSTSINNRTETTTHVLPGSTGSPGYPTGGYPTGGYPNGGYPTGGYPNGGYPTGGRPGSPDEPSALTVQPVTGPNGPGEPDGPDGPNGKNISITINKTTTTHTSHSGHPGHPGHPGYPGGQPNCLHETTVSCGPQCSFGPNGINPTKRPVNDSPLTSTPYPTRGRSTSPEPRDGGMPVPPGNVHLNYTNNVYHHSHSDSLERVRRPKHHGLPFPDTSPIKGQANGKIPRKVDDLMTSFTDSEDGPPYPRSGRSHYPEPEDEPLIPANAKIEVRAQADASALAVADAGPDPTKNVCGPAVYYPPGHEMFHETMHTMTLKESNRRGKAKWRMEKQEGYKESASHSETTGEMKMIPVCLPLCCGAACTIM